MSRYVPRMLRDDAAGPSGPGAKMGLDFARLQKPSPERLPARPEVSLRVPPSAASDHDCERGGITALDFITTPDTKELPAQETLPTSTKKTRAGAKSRSVFHSGFMDLSTPRSMVKMTNRESLLPLAQISLLFFLWGFAYGLLDVLNSQFQVIVKMSFGQTMGLHSAYFGAYLVAPLSFGRIVLRKWGFKATFITGLCIYACGTLIFWPSAVLTSFPAFLASNFIVGLGLSTLEIAANPFIALCGPQQYMEIRLNFAQGIQAIGSVISPILARRVLFKQILDAPSLVDVQWTYLGIALFDILLAVAFYYLPLPEASDDDLEEAAAGQSTVNSARIGAVRVTLLTLGLGAFSQWCYVGGQETVSMAFTHVVKFLRPRTSTLKASDFQAIAHAAFAVGRFGAAVACIVLKPRRVLLIFYLGCVVTAVLAMRLPGDAGLAFSILVHFFECDGGIPACATCSAVYFSECEYDTQSDHRRKGALKRDLETLQERNDSLGIIFEAIKSASEAELAEIIQQIRSNDDLELLAESLRHNVPLPEGSGSPPSFEGDLSEIMGKPTMDESGETRYFGHTSSLSLTHQKDVPARSDVSSELWTKVTLDEGFIAHLVGLYFCWSHPFYPIIHKQSFLNDYAMGRTKYCSSLLVNVVLALACPLSDRPEARVDPEDANTAGDHFFAEAKRLLDQDKQSSVTTIQALALMSIREPNHNRDSTGYGYMGRSLRMALELGLHLSYPANGPFALSASDAEARRQTFWAVFTLETLWGICVGRLPQIPTSAISVENVRVTDCFFESKPWKPYIDTGDTFGPELEQPSVVEAMLRHYSDLALIMNDTLNAFYAPRIRMTSKSLLVFYARCTAWYDGLPKELLPVKTPSPAILMLSMVFHDFIIHLFRPFLKVRLLGSTVSPRAACTQSAEEISRLMTTYRDMYGLRRIVVLAAHIILSSSTILLLNLPCPKASRNLVQCIRDLEEMSAHNIFCYRSLDIIRSLAQKWSIAIPEEAQPRDTASRNIETTARSSSLGGPSTGEPGVTQPSPEIPELIPDDLFWLPFCNPMLPELSELRPMQFTGMSDSEAYNWEQLSQDGFEKANVHDPSERRA
ncbi:hypothetical protein FGG08_002097 [Glutinoglossum americanum]|uniref:Xylanolytic transcriptional activator regulatory domain-containing protein n=1 Tax=Glutinoglossum americanum TaxID=1670608 RepID=A0A9P8L238_9PEZI|nr:hypothetical protein FGG08_002097 [Glutinoglossum americanum]